jgi:hypothetical protein
MAKTGERYGAARRSLVAHAAEQRANGWVSQPETGDAVLRNATGRGWDEWCTLIDAFAGRDAGHTRIAAHVQSTYDVDGWWAQTITVGYERIRGLRLPYQNHDGRFTAGRTQTITVDVDALRVMLLDEAERKILFPAFDTQLRSRPSSKNVRLTIAPGTAEIALSPTSDGRTKVTVAHSKLPSPDDVTIWKQFWTEWIDALEDPS